MAGGNEWATGPLDLFVPVNFQVEHWQLSNPSNPSTPWTFQQRFGGGINSVLGVAQGHRGAVGFDLVCQTSVNTLEHWVLSHGIMGGWTANMFAQLP